MSEESLASENGQSFRSFLTTLIKMRKSVNKKNVEKTTMVDGVLAIGKTSEGQNVLDFMSMETVEVPPFIGDCKVQVMRNGDTYITQKPKRIHNTPLFREDNCSLTLGRDGKYHFIFTLPEELVDKLPERLMLQALAIAQKVERIILKKQGRKGLVGRIPTTK